LNQLGVGKAGQVRLLQKSGRDINRSLLRKIYPLSASRKTEGMR